MGERSGKWYYLDGSGVMQTGWKKLVESGTIWMEASDADWM